MSEKVKPVCPNCKTVGNMAGTMAGPIFCATCGWMGNAEEIWASMKAQLRESRSSEPEPPAHPPQT